MYNLRAHSCPYSIIRAANSAEPRPVYPFFRDEGGDKIITVVSPQHGRSFIVGKDEENRYIISKGNGLSYTTASYIKTSESMFDVWGLLLKQDAIRDFVLGNEVASLGIQTNRMEYVLELDNPIQVCQERSINPILLQYSVECPFRISDALFIDKSCIEEYVWKWPAKFNIHEELPKHLIAAEVIVRTLSTLHKHGIIHNAITSQNITWALELLDFELACSPSHPYDNVDSQRHYVDLFERELIYAYNIILDIAGVLGEEADFSQIENVFSRYDLMLKCWDYNRR